MTAASCRQGEGQGRGGGWWGPLPSTVHHCSFRGVVWCRHIAGHTYVGGHHLYSHHELETLTTNFKIKITSIKNKDAWSLTFLPPVSCMISVLAHSYDKPQFRPSSVYELVSCHHTWNILSEATYIRTYLMKISTSSRLYIRTLRNCTK